MIVQKKKSPVVALPGLPEVKKRGVSLSKLIDARGKKKKAVTTNLIGKYLCLCGCGKRTDYTFCRGHVNKLRGWLIRLKAGEGTPKAVGMPLDLARRLGPWKEKAGGLIPTKKYDDLIR